MINDLISRQAAIDAVEEYFGGLHIQGRYDILQIIKSLPSAEIKEKVIIQRLPSAEKKGKWILNRQGNWACSLCGNDPYHDNMKNMNYCPNCGARMSERRQTMSEFVHWCGNCQIRIYIQRHYGEILTWHDCPYVCEYATKMRCSAEQDGERRIE